MTGYMVGEAPAQTEVTTAVTLGWSALLAMTGYMVGEVPAQMEATTTATLGYRIGKGSARTGMDKDFNMYIHQQRQLVACECMLHTRLSVLKGRPESKYTYRCDNKKQRKIDSLQEVISSPQHSLDKIILTSQPIFYSRRNNKQNPSKSVKKIMMRCQDTAIGYLPSRDLRGIQMAKLLVEWQEIKGVTSPSHAIWASIACGKNYYLNSHTDEDFFYSMTMITSEQGLRHDIDRYKMDAEVCNYFAFPEQGIAVALRPGDMLIFNPLYHHCLSPCTTSYKADDVFCLLFYLKTVVVGKNDNSLPLMERETDFAERDT